MGNRLWDRDNGVHHIIIGVLIPIGKRIINCFVGVPILTRRVAKFDGGEAAAVCFMEDSLQGWICLVGGGVPRVKFFEGEDVRGCKNPYRVRNYLFGGNMGPAQLSGLPGTVQDGKIASQASRPGSLGCRINCR